MNASRWTRVLLAIAAVLLGLTLFVPLWRVSLTAPQYPEGIGMRIWAHTVSGAGPNDLQNINGLNHYIGMKTIEPDAIPELRFMPWGIGAMCVLGLALAAFGRRRWIIAWSVALMLAGCVGLADFWKWEYDYGHNLDLEHAPIQIPGMSYQPPLIGTQQLLNFTATSLPDIGGWLAMAAVALSVLAVLGKRGAAITGDRDDQRRNESNTGSAALTANALTSSALISSAMPSTAKATHAVASSAALVLVAMTLVACGDGPRDAKPVSPATSQRVSERDTPRDVLRGADACAACRMTVDDPRFAGQVKTAKGKTETFDSIECLASFVNALPKDSPPRGIWVSDAAHPGRWIPAASAHFIRNGALHSPMGRTLAAFDASAVPTQLMATYGGALLGWSDVQALMVADANADMHAGHDRIAALHE